MKPLWLILLFAVSLAAPADLLAARAVTFYLDGARVEQRETASKGYLEIKVPPAADQESLRIAPAKGGEILRVVTSPVKPAISIEKELARLTDREELLKDRLKALSVREEIFKSAAKSQSAKAPKRTKTNPEPLSTIKQGTDYAISQLESVYQSKRKVEKELEQIAARRQNLSKDRQSGGTLAKVWTTPASIAVTASWSQPDRSWYPLYQIRSDAKGSAVLSMSAGGVATDKGESATLVISSVKSDGVQQKIAFVNDQAIIVKEEFKITETVSTDSKPYVISINGASRSLPPGDITCFKSGVYMGKGRFNGVDADKSVEIRCGGN
ncbi:MAG: DUF4140 domain-containing protein [Geobacteraceae bacterium]|nr:DUF4140 domain-containing protein [Geobacteraceae bacterium]